MDSVFKAMNVIWNWDEWWQCFITFLRIYISGM